MRFIITTGADGIRDDSQESILIGGERVIFTDADGDGVPDSSAFHQGGTGDKPNTRFIWDTRLNPCVPATALLGGFEFQHYDYPIFDFHTPDEWDLKSLTIENLDRLNFAPCCSNPVPTLFTYYSKQGDPLHHFHGSAFEGDAVVWNTNDGQPPLDTDGDGLTDRDELFGFRGANSATLDRWLPLHGSDPCRKTIAVQINWLNNIPAYAKPSSAALDQARQMFANSPVISPADFYGCPYYRNPPFPTGIQLLTDLAGGIDPVIGQGSALKQYFSADEAEANAFPSSRKGKFFFSLWGNTWDTTSTTGSCCLPHTPDRSAVRPGDENGFAITLGAWPQSRVTDQVKSVDFVHELGHALGLGHAGDGNEPNYKPNYLSVMNYRYSEFGLPDYPAWKAELQGMSQGPTGTTFDPGSPAAQMTLERISRLDYSSEQLPTLPRIAGASAPWWQLVERTGVGSSQGTVVTWFDRSGTLRIGSANGGLDWDWSGNGTPDPNAGPEDVNIMGGYEKCATAGRDGQFKMGTSPLDMVVGTTLYAGPDGICETSSFDADDNDMIAPTTDSASSALIPSPGFDYPMARNYELGLRGFNDWAHIKFRIGVSPDARTRLPPGDNSGTEPDLQAHNQAVADLVKAFLVTTGLYDPGPPAHGRLIDTLSPSYTSSPNSSLFVYTAQTFSPQGVTFDPAAFPGRPSAVLPYIRQPDSTPRRYQIACHVRTSAPSGTVFRLLGAPGAEERRWVPAGDVTLRFNTYPVSQAGWQFWTLASVGSAPWTLRACDLYEMTDTGLAPAPAPAPHPPPPAPQPPVVATLNIRYPQASNAALLLTDAYALGAAQGATFQPALTGSGSVQVTFTPPDASPHVYTISFDVKSAVSTRYSIGKQIVTAPAGDATISFTVTTRQAQSETWTLTELGQAAWTFRSCNIAE